MLIFDVLGVLKMKNPTTRIGFYDRSNYYLIANNSKFKCLYSTVYRGSNKINTFV